MYSFTNGFIKQAFNLNPFTWFKSAPKPVPIKILPQPDIKGLKKGVTLQQHQIRFLNHFNKGEGIGMAAHEVGAGKTLSSIAGFLDRKAKGKAKTALVLVPASLKNNFAKNIKEFSNSSHEILESTEAKPGKDFYIVSKDKFIKDPEGYMKATKADTVIIDELQRAKDVNTVYAKSLSEIRPSLKTLIGLTGTPFNNRPEEFFQLLSVIKGEKISKKKMESFLKRKPRNLAEILKLKPARGDISGFRNTKELKEFAGPFVDIVDTPTGAAPKKELHTSIVKMTPEERAIYRKVLNTDLTTEEQRILSSRGVPVALRQKVINKAMGARQQSNNAGYLLKKMIPSSKAIQVADDLQEHLDISPKNKGIVFSSFIDTGIDVMSGELERCGIKHEKFLGMKHTPAKVRNAAVQKYNSGESRVMLVSGAGGEGLSLPDTTMVQMLDGHYNPSALVQREGRGIRIGGQLDRPEKDRKVSVIRYVADPGIFTVSLDKEIYDIAGKKEELNQLMKKILESTG